MHKRSLLPPRKRDVVEGKTQIGLFIRVASGRVVEATANNTTEVMCELAFSLLQAMSSGIVKPEQIAKMMYALDAAEPFEVKS